MHILSQPLETLRAIFQFTDTQTLLKCRRVCKMFKLAVDWSPLWNGRKIVIAHPVYTISLPPIFDQNVQIDLSKLNFRSIGFAQQMRKILTSRKISGLDTMKGDLAALLCAICDDRIASARCEHCDIPICKIHIFQARHWVGSRFCSNDCALDFYLTRDALNWYCDCCTITLTECHRCRARRCVCEMQKVSILHNEIYLCDDCEDYPVW